MDKALEDDVYSCTTLILSIICSEHELLWPFLKIKPPIFVGAEIKDSFKFIMDRYERFPKMDIKEKHGVKCIFLVAFIYLNSVPHLIFWNICVMHSSWLKDEFLTIEQSTITSMSCLVFLLK